MNFSEYRNAVKSAREELVAIKNKHKAAENAAKDNYTKNYIDKMVTKHEVEYLDALKKQTESLATKYKALEMKNKANLTRFVSDTPSKEIADALAFMKSRDTVSYFEIGVLADKCKDNFQARVILKEIAEKNGYHSMVLPDIDTINNDMEKSLNVCKDMTRILDMDASALSYREMEFLNGEYGAIATPLKDLDDFMEIFVKEETPIVAKEKNALEIIDDAIAEARKNGDYYRSVKLRMLRNKKAEEFLATDAKYQALKEEIDACTDEPLSAE